MQAVLNIVQGVIVIVVGAGVLAAIGWLWRFGKRLLETQKQMATENALLHSYIEQIQKQREDEVEYLKHVLAFGNAAAEQLGQLDKRVADLEVSESRFLRGTFDRSPEARRIKQTAKSHEDQRGTSAV